MQLATGATVAVADGRKFSLFRNAGKGLSPDLNAVRTPEIGSDNKSSGVHRYSGAANPDDSQLEEDSFAAGAAALLNKEVLAGKITDLVVIAAPRTLGELRKHYHQKLSEALVGEIAKDLTGQTTKDIEKAILAA